MVRTTSCTPTSTLTTKGQTTVPKEVRNALALEPGDKLSWEVRGGRVAVTTERPSLLDFEGFIKTVPATSSPRSPKRANVEVESDTSRRR